MRLWNLTWMILVAGVIGPLAERCGAQVTFNWNPSGSPGLAGYNLCWGTSSGDYSETNFSPNGKTSLTISNLNPGQSYYFAVQAVASNGAVSPFSNEEGYTNGAPSSPGGGPSGGPPSPGGSPSGTPTNNNSQVVNNPGNGNNSGSSSNNNNSSSSSSTTGTASSFWGIPPLLSMAVSNGEASLNIGAIVGQTLTVMATTNDLSQQAWSSVTNVLVTNLAPIAATNTSPPQDLLDIAYVPGALTQPVGPTQGSQFQFFQLAMPYDYIILADQVLLTNTNYTPRLIAITLSSSQTNDVCYVNQAGSFIYFIQTNTSLQLVNSQSTIRQVANSLASSLNLTWTSASEFIYSNGIGLNLATVSETGNPSQDPVAGATPNGTIVIDF